MEEFKMYPSHKELFGSDGEAIEFEWHIFQVFSSLQILQEIQRDLERKSIEPEEIIFMSMFSDTDWTTRGNDEKSVSNAEKSRTFLGPGSEKKWYGGSSLKWNDDSKKPVIPCSKASVL